jgi:hypothetical protein
MRVCAPTFCRMSRRCRGAIGPRPRPRRGWYPRRGQESRVSYAAGGRLCAKRCYERYLNLPYSRVVFTPDCLSRRQHARASITRSGALVRARRRPRTDRRRSRRGQGDGLRRQGPRSRLRSSMAEAPTITRLVLGRITLAEARNLVSSLSETHNSSNGFESSKRRPDRSPNAHLPARLEELLREPERRGLPSRASCPAGSRQSSFGPRGPTRARCQPRQVRRARSSPPGLEQRRVYGRRSSRSSPQNVRPPRRDRRSSSHS